MVLKLDNHNYLVECLQIIFSGIVKEIFTKKCIAKNGDSRVSWGEINEQLPSTRFCILFRWQGIEIKSVSKQKE